MIKKKYRDVNVLVRSSDYVLKNVIKLHHSNITANNLLELSDFLKRSYNIPGVFYNCDFDIECKKKYFRSLIVNQNALLLDTDFKILTFNQYFEITDDEILSINALLEGGGSGGFIDVLNIYGYAQSILHTILLLFKFISYTYAYIMAFHEVCNKYGYGRLFLYDVIKYEDKIKVGFLKGDKIKKIDAVENAIMKKFGYKKRNNFWIRKNMPALFDERNKYEKC